MAFEIGRFNENLITSATQRIENVVEAKMGTITSTATTAKYWFGHTAEEYKQIQKDLYDLGQILTANYFVHFEAYENNGLTSNPIFNNPNIPYLATETNIPLIQANFEQIQVGGRQIQQLTNVTEADIQLNMLETGQGDIGNGLLDWVQLMVNDDGTVNPPASYACRLTVGIFHRQYGLDVKPISRTFLVAPSQAMIESLNANGVSEALIIPTSYVVLRDFME